MSLTVAQARDELSKMVKDIWPANRTLIYDDVAGSKPATTQMWGRLTIRHVDGFQATLSGSDSKKRFRRTGILTVQIFTPSGKGLSTADEYAKIVLDAFEGQQSPGGIWFRNAQVQEVGPDGNFYQTNVVVTFEYDEMK